MPQKSLAPPEIIEDGKIGILVKPGNPDLLAEAMINLLNKPGFQPIIAENGYDMVQEGFLSIHVGLADEEMFHKLFSRLLSPAKQ